MGSQSPVTSLYVHVPFCAHKCEYCAFFSRVPQGDIIGHYITALVREMELVAADLKPRTVFFGGGTPSILSLEQWKRILQSMERLRLLGAAEWTIECNPATVSADKAAMFRDFGVNRLSLGVQSFDEALLNRLGRIHTRRMVFESFELLRKAGFDNLNLDLMFGIPGQTMEIWKTTLREAVALGSEHLSCYEVIYEQDTPLFEQLNAGKFDVNEDLNCAMYDELIDFSQANGFQQYEVANFAEHTSAVPAEIPNRACQHNVNYWRGGDFHGLGPSAAGYVRGVRTKNWSNTTVYCEQLEKGQRAIESQEKLSPLGRAGELAAFGLRMNAGWPFADFKARTGYDLRSEWRAEIDRLVGLEYGVIGKERFHLTRRGLRFADWAAELFLRV